MNTRAVIVLLLAAMAGGGCRDGREGDQQTGSVRAEDVQRAREALSPEVREHLDAGNEAYREARYPQALEHYRQAAELDEHAAAAWFGIYMAESALGNAEAAEAAIQRAREAAPGATLVEPETPQ